LRLSESTQHVGSDNQLPFEVVAYASLNLQGRGSHGYRGRSHSLGYCDAQETGRFAWYELAFMQTLGGSGSIAPFALTPSEGATALSPAMGTKQLARSLRRLSMDELDPFVRRWGEWFADAYQGSLSHPSQLPEEAIQTNYRGAR
jgi:eukaryotic-like serine/threonine-protein kinase